MSVRTRIPAAVFAAVLFPFILLTAVSCGPKENPEKEDPIVNPDPQPVEAPVIKAESVSLNAAGDTYQIPFTIENPVDGVLLKASIVGESTWAALGEPGKDSVPVTLQDNLSSSRSFQMELSYQGAEKVTITVTQEQWKYPEFEISISKVGPFGATFTVNRKAGYRGGYFFEVIGRDAFDRYVAGDKNKIGDIAFGEAIYQADLAYLNNMAQKHGHSLGMLFSMLGSMYSKDDSVSMPYSSLDTDTEYIFLVYGMEDSDAATRRTPICLYSFKTGYSTDSELEFSGSASDIAENYATIKVIPSNNEEYWYLDYASEIDLKSRSLADVMQNSINNAKSFLGRYTAEQILCKGPEELQITELMPNTEYSVIAWGMSLDMAATTAPKVAFTFKTLDYNIVDDCRFNIEVTKIEDMDVQVRVTPTNNSTRYYVAFVAKSIMAGYTDEQAAQRIINMESSRIEQGYYNVDNLSWANLPGMGSGVREIWGRKDEGWTFQPKHDYRIYAFGVDNFGIRSTAVDAIDVTTAEAGASNNHFQVTIESNTWLGVDYKVTPELNDEYWMPFVAETAEIETYFRNADGTLKEQELFEWIEEYYEDEINYNSFRGERTLHQHVTPDTDYTILVFGYAGTYTTRMYEWQVSVPKPPIGKSTADISISYELFRGEDLADIDSRVWPHVDFDGDCVMVMRIQPTDNAAHWYCGVWPPKENFRDNGGLYYIMTLDMNDTVSAVDKKNFNIRPWWYGCGNGSATRKEPWRDDEGNTMDYYPWTISGWAEDASGNYGPFHYDYLIPVPVPKGQETGNYECGYTQAYNFWSSPSGSGVMKVYNVSKGIELK